MSVSSSQTYSLSPDPGWHTVTVTDPTGAVQTYSWPGNSAIVANGGGSYTLTFAAQGFGAFQLNVTADQNAAQAFTVSTAAAVVQADQATLPLKMPGLIGA